MRYRLYEILPQTMPLRPTWSMFRLIAQADIILDLYAAIQASTLPDGTEGLKRESVWAVLDTWAVLSRYRPGSECQDYSANNPWIPALEVMEFISRGAGLRDPYRQDYVSQGNIRCGAD